MRDPRDIIIRPVLTEKSLRLQKEANAYVFEVSRKANKPQIKKAVEDLFKVKVVKVSTVNLKGKPRRRYRAVGRTRSYKKAIVFLKEGDTIRLFEGG